MPDARGGERAGRERPAAGLCVARDRAEQSPQQRARRAVRERAVPGHALAPAKEPRTEHVVGAPARHRFKHAFEVGGVVLAVAVDVERRGIALVAGYLQARAQGSPEPL
jgi:hypothetical protein